MADFDMNADPLPFAGMRTLYFDNVDRLANLWGPSSTVEAVITIFKMRSMDALVNGLHDTWLTSSTPDLLGTYYVGALATPLRDIIVIDTWDTA